MNFILFHLKTNEKEEKLQIERKGELKIVIIIICNMDWIWNQHR